MVTVAAVAAGAALAAGGILRATQEEAILSGPEYIRDAQPEGLTRRIGLGLARAACQRYANNPSALNADRAVSYENACRPYLDSVNGGEGAGISKPFNGGQCAVPYTISVSGTVSIIRCSDGVTTFTGQVSNSGGGILGPISALRLVGTVPGACGTTRSQVQGVDGNGLPFSFTGLSGASNTGSRSEYSNVQFTLTRSDGLPDTCGNPPPVIDPPKPPGTPFPVPFPIVIAPDINIDGTVELFPDGTINVDIGTGDITIDPFGDEPDPDPGGGGTGGNAPGGAEGGPVIPGGNGGFGGDDELGPPPAGKRWVGVCLAITNRPEGFGVIPSNTVDKVYPEVVGNVRLICNAMGTEITNTPVQIRSDRVCLWEPARGVTVEAIRVNLGVGFGYSYQGYAVPLDN